MLLQHRAPKIYADKPTHSRAGRQCVTCRAPIPKAHKRQLHRCSKMYITQITTCCSLHQVDMAGVLSSHRKQDSAAGRVTQAARYCQNSSAPISASLLLCRVANVCTLRAGAGRAGQGSSGNREWPDTASMPSFSLRAAHASSSGLCATQDLRPCKIRANVSAGIYIHT